MGNKTQPWFGAARRLSERSTDSCGLAVDKDGVTLGPDFPLIRKTSRGYETATIEELSCLRKIVSLGTKDTQRLARHLESIAKALTAGDFAKARILGLYFPIDRLTRDQADRLRKASAVSKGNFNPDEPRDERGRWTTTGAGTTPPSRAFAPSREGLEAGRSLENDRNIVPVNDWDISGPSDLSWCIDACTELVLKRRIGVKRAPDQGMAYRRCLNQCMGINDYPEWRSYFPPQTNQQATSSKSRPLPWWAILPFLPIPGNPAYAGF